MSILLWLFISIVVILAFPYVLAAIGIFIAIVLVLLGEMIEFMTSHTVVVVIVVTILLLIILKFI